MPTKKVLDITKLSQRTADLTARFSNHIFGQQEATEALTNVLEKFHSGIYDRTKPIASLLFLGPTGTGKTASVEAFVTGLFGSPDKMLKVDCAEFQHSHEIARLIGSPPGYLGHRETSPYITAAKVVALQTVEFPFTVILFDEIEKASDALWSLLLGVLDRGVLTLGTNDHVDLTSTVIVMTSNVGSKEMAKQNGGDGALGFSSPASEALSTKELADISRSAARAKFMPEFLNRLDEIVVFNTLTRDDIKRILKLEVLKFQEQVIRTSKAVIHIDISPSAEKQILANGFDKKYGARFLKREIEKRVIVPVARVIASRQVFDQDTVVIDYDGEFKYYGGFF